MSSRNSAAAPSSPDAPVWRATAAGLCASLVGIGLARFAYTPLIPALIAAGWFTPGQAAYVGAANLLGYLAGALAARWLARRLPPRPLLRAMMLLATVAFFACAWQLWLPWFYLWRSAAGAAGGVLMVLAAPSILPFVPAHRRGLAGGAIFTGVGLGIAASGTLIRPLLTLGVSTAWVGLGVVALALTALSWRDWPATAPPVVAHAHGAHGRAGLPLVAVIVAYGLNAVGLVPHMVFLVDYVARDLGRGFAAGALCWVVFGLGAIAGPTATGALADRIGFVAALRLAFFVQAIAVALPLVSSATPVLLLSAALAGAFVPGAVTLTLGRIHVLTTPGSDAARAGWSWATTAWAVGQAAAAYACSALIAGSGTERPLFAFGCVALALALLVDILAGATPRAPA